MKSPLNRGGLRFYLVIAALLLGHPTLLSIAAGTALTALGIALHVWAKGCLHQNLEVTACGPYRFVRHPFYAANALIDFGVAAMSGSWLLCLALPVWWLLVYLPVIRSEERYLCSVFGSAYREYLARVPMLLPFRTPLPPAVPGFSWSNANISAGTEIPRALRIAAYPLLFCISANVRANGIASFLGADSLGLPLLAGVLLLHALAILVNRHLKHARPILPAFCYGLTARAIAAAVVIVLAAAIRFAETEIHSVIFPLGGCLLILSALVCYNRRTMLFIAECCALTATAILCEVVWLAPLPILYYSGLLLDTRLNAHAWPASAALSPLVEARLRRTLYHAAVACAVLAAIGKELLLS